MSKKRAGDGMKGKNEYPRIYIKKEGVYLDLKIGLIGYKYLYHVEKISGEQINECKIIFHTDGTVVKVEHSIKQYPMNFDAKEIEEQIFIEFSKKREILDCSENDIIKIVKWLQPLKGKNINEQTYVYQNKWENNGIVFYHFAFQCDEKLGILYSYNEEDNEDGVVGIIEVGTDEMKGFNVISPFLFGEDNIDMRKIIRQHPLFRLRNLLQ
jgi:hypothetical protein